MNAILKAELVCETLSLEKPQNDPDLSADFSVYGHLDDIYACIWGRRYNRKLLRWAVIDRYDFMLWCERRGIPLPDFWFPLGWHLEYELPENVLLPGYSYLRRDELLANKDDHSKDDAAATTPEGEFPRPVLVTESAGVRDSDSAIEASESQNTPVAISKRLVKEEEAQEKIRANQTARIACQQIASAIWKDEPTRTIASVIKDELIQKYGGGVHYQDATIREWIKVVAPRLVREKRGRPPKKNVAAEN